MSSPGLRAALLSSVFLFTACPAAPSVPAEITAVMKKDRYLDAGTRWGLIAMDTATGEVLTAVEPDQLSYTGSVRKLLSVSSALEALGPDHRFETPVYRAGAVVAGVLAGDLVLVASGDLTFGGRAKSDGSLDLTDFDHNEAHAFGDTRLTPQDPLAALDALAAQVRDAGITQVTGDVVVDDRLFEAFRVPNGNVLISPMLVNENLVDVLVSPGAQAGQPGTIDWRPKTAAVRVAGAVTTTAAGTDADLELSGDAFASIALGCQGTPGCQGVISGRADAGSPAALPVDYRSPVVGEPRFAGTLRVEDPASFARTAFIEALARAGVTVAAPPVQPNAAARLPARGSYDAANRVAVYASPRFAETAKLVLKVSLNTGANLSLMHAGLSKGARTVTAALAAERAFLTTELGLDGAGFDLPTNGSGSPDSRATPRLIATLLTKMSQRPGATALREALPVMGVEASVAGFGRTLPGHEHIAVKSGATVMGGQMVALNIAGYVETKQGRRLAVVVFVNDAGPLTALQDTLDVWEDEGRIASYLYEHY